MAKMMAPREVTRSTETEKMFQLFMRKVKLISQEEYLDAAENDDGLNWFLNHLKTMCNYNNDVCNFVLMWLAQMVQYPEMKSVQLVFRTRPGTGSTEDHYHRR